MKVMLIFVEIAIIVFLFFYFNKRMDEQNQEIMKLKDTVNKTQVKSATDTDYMKAKYYDLEKLFQTLTKEK